MKYKIITIVAIILVSVGVSFSQTIQPTPALEERVLSGRVVVNQYRVSHDSMYNDKGMILDRHSEFLSIMIAGLIDAGYNITNSKPDILYNFFDDNNIYNAKQLGFNDMEDFNEKATIKNANDFLALWK